MELSILPNSNATSPLCQFWDYDDVTKCGRFELEYYPPLIIGTISFVILLIKSTISLRKRRQGNQIHLDTSNDTETRPLFGKLKWLWDY